MDAVSCPDVSWANAAWLDAQVMTIVHRNRRNVKNTLLLLQKLPWLGFHCEQCLQYSEGNAAQAKIPGHSFLTEFESALAVLGNPVRDRRFEHKNQLDVPVLD
jgi:hypothetical protein